MLVRHLCYYLTEWGGIKPRQEDYNTNKVVKCLKDEAIKGYSNITIGGVNFRLTDGNESEFLQRLWAAVGALLNDSLNAPAAIVPIPNSGAVVDAPPTYRTLEFAKAIAAASSGKVVAVDALRWKEQAEAIHRQGGFRAPEPRYDNLQLIRRPERPVILFDDVIASGSSFVGSYWRLQEAGVAPNEGLVVARRTPMQQPKMFINEQQELEIPQRPFF